MVATMTDLEAEDVKDVDISDFTIFGFKSKAEGRAAEIHNLVTDGEMLRTIDGAPTLTFTVDDPGRLLAQTKLLSYRVVFTLDTFAYELAQVKKAGDAFTLVFEDVRVAEMRRRTNPRKVPANTMSRVEFGYLLLSELPAIDFTTPPIDLSVTHNELARGKDKPTAGEVPEDTWKALTRIFGEVKWRFWVDKGRAYAAPDTYLIDLPSAGTVIEYTNGVDTIDFDLDAGKRVQTAVISVVSDRWSLPIGAVVDLGSTGPSQGKWLVSEIRRNLYSRMSTVKCVLPVFPLTEPAASKEAGTGTAPTGGLGSIAGGGTPVPAPAGTYQAYAAKQAQALYGWGPDQFAAIDEIWTAESHWRPDAQNPNSTAYGIAQFLDGTWAGTGIAKTSDGYRQIDAGLIYIRNRYGTPIQALQFRHAHGWY